MKRLLYCAIAFVFMLSACAPVTAVQPAQSEKAPAAVQNEKVVLKYWNGFTGPDRVVLEALVKQFNDSHPNIEVQMDIMPWDSLFQKLLTSMTVGAEPDIAAFSFRNMPEYAKAGVLMPLDDLYGPAGIDPNTLPPSYLDIIKYDGKYYGAPMNFATLMMYYNKDLFKAAGLDPEKPPTTWEEWTDAVQKLTIDENKDGKPEQYGLVLADHQTIPMWPILVWGNGGKFISNDGKQSMLDDPKTIEAFEKWGALVAKQGISPVGLTGAEADKLFETGKAAMEMNGPWMTGGYTAAGLNYDVAPIPAGPAGQVTLADAAVMVINKNTKNKDAAYEFFKFWNSKEAQATWALGSGFPPARTDLESAAMSSNPFVAKFASAAPYAHFYLPGLEKFNAIDSDIITPAIQTITRGLNPAAETLKDAATKMNGQIGQ
jgi:multiple sugar transport system substrate-binding protein